MHDRKHSGMIIFSWPLAHVPRHVYVHGHRRSGHGSGRARCRWLKIMIDKLLRRPMLAVCQPYGAFIGSAVTDESSSKTTPQFDSHISALTCRFLSSPIVSPCRSTSHMMTPIAVLILVALQQLV